MGERALAGFPASIFADAAGALRVGVLDLGFDHYAQSYSRHGDASDAVVGFHVLHPRGPQPLAAFEDSEWCVGGIVLAVPEAEGLSGARWTVVSLEPLHVEPSLLCQCGDHGFIHGGRWVPA